MGGGIAAAGELPLIDIVPGQRLGLALDLKGVVLRGKLQLVVVADRAGEGEFVRGALRHMIDSGIPVTEGRVCQRDRITAVGRIRSVVGVDVGGAAARINTRRPAFDGGRAAQIDLTAGIVIVNTVFPAGHRAAGQPENAGGRIVVHAVARGGVLARHRAAGHGEGAVGAVAHAPVCPLHRAAVQRERPQIIDSVIGGGRAGIGDRACAVSGAVPKDQAGAGVDRDGVAAAHGDGVAVQAQADLSRDGQGYGQVFVQTVASGGQGVGVLLLTAHIDFGRILRIHGDRRPAVVAVGGPVQGEGRRRQQAQQHDKSQRQTQHTFFHRCFPLFQRLPMRHY